MSKGLKVEKEKLQQFVQESIHRTFSSFFKIEPELISVELREASKTFVKTRNISGMMALVDGGVHGTFSVGLSKESALTLLSNFYGEPLQSLDDPRVVEGIAEIANVSHGLLKEKLNELGHHFHMVLPLVVVGANHTGFSEDDAPVVTLKFKTDIGEIVAEVVLQKEIQKKAKAA